MPAVAQPDPGRAAVPHKAVIRAGDKFCSRGIQQTELSVPAHRRIAVQQRGGAAVDQGFLCVIVWGIDAVIAGFCYLAPGSVQIYPFAVALGGGQRCIKEKICGCINGIVGGSAVFITVGVLPIADKIIPVVALAVYCTAAGGHRAVGAAAVPQQIILCRGAELARAEAAAVYGHSMLLQIDKFQIAVAVVPVTDHTIAAGLQLTGIFLSQRVGSLPRKTICVVVPMAVAETTFKQRLRRAAGQNLTAVAAHQAPLAVLAHRVVFDLGVGLQFPRIAEEPYIIVVQHRRAGFHESLRRHGVSCGCGRRRDLGCFPGLRSGGGGYSSGRYAAGHIRPGGTARQQQGRQNAEPKLHSSTPPLLFR